MNRKRQRSALALSATMALLALLLIAGRPQPPAPALRLVAIERQVNGAHNRTDRGTRVRRHSRRSRTALALPYFSFAQGLRRISGN